MSMSGRKKHLRVRDVWRGFGVFQCFVPPKTKMAKIQLQMAVFPLSSDCHVSFRGCISFGLRDA